MSVEVSFLGWNNSRFPRTLRRINGGKRPPPLTNRGKPRFLVKKKRETASSHTTTDQKQRPQPMAATSMIKPLMAQHGKRRGGKDARSTTNHRPSGVGVGEVGCGLICMWNSNESRRLLPLLEAGWWCRDFFHSGWNGCGRVAA